MNLLRRVVCSMMFSFTVEALEIKGYLCTTTGFHSIYYFTGLLLNYFFDMERFVFWRYLMCIGNETFISLTL